MRIASPSDGQELLVGAEVVFDGQVESEDFDVAESASDRVDVDVQD